MAKGSKRPRKPAGKSTEIRTRDDVFREEDLDDEVDAFHKQRDIVPLDPDNEDGDSDDETEQPVFDFEDDEDDSDSNRSGGGDDEDANDSDDHVDNSIQPKGFAAKIARQAKYLREKFGGIDDDMDDDVKLDEEERKAVWGRKKNLYYDADNVDYELQSSDEDLPMEEEAEVVKIQKEKAKFLSMEDFGLEDADQIHSDSDGKGKKFLDVFTGKNAVAKHSADAVPGDSHVGSYEDTKMDLSALTKEEQMEVVYSSAPELVGLLTELTGTLNELKILKPLLPEVEKQRKDVAKGGMNFLELKQILLLSYCQAISFYLLLKSEGHPVQDHPVIARLVEIKNLLEKVKEIGANVSPQIEEIVDYKSDPRNKVAEDSIPLDSVPGMMDTAAEATNSYTAVVNETVQLVKDSSNDIVNKNINKKQQDTTMGFQSMEMLKVRANLEAKLKQKGIFNMTNPKPANAQNFPPRPANHRLETFDDFDDEVYHTSVLQSRKPSQLLSTKVKKQKFVSGDDDLPKRDDIGERRRKFELRVLSRAGADSLGDDDGDTGDKDKKTRPMNVAVEEDGEPLESEDEFYKQVKQQQAGKLMAKAQLYSRTPTAPLPQLEIEADGKRLISYQMEKNRGLTRSRKKLLKNPRKKYKIKHQKAVIRRKGQVRDIRKPTGPYGGEATGINANVSRSIRFNN